MYNEEKMNTHFSCADTALAEVFPSGLWPPSSANLAWGHGCPTVCCTGQTSLPSAIPVNSLPLDSHLCIDI